MEPFLWTAVILLCVLCLLLFFKIRLLQRSAEEIRTEFLKRLSTETNTLLDVSSGDIHIRRLAAEINHQLVLLRAERQKYQQGDMELKEAVANISHDLRTPLTAINGYLQLLNEEEISAKGQEYLRIIGKRTEALTQLTEELFRYSVLSSFSESKGEKLLLNQVLEESLLSFYGVMKQKNIEPEITISKTGVEREMNRSALMRVFGNIINNAVKYSDGDLSVKMTDKGEITFSNRAKGLDAVETGKLFDRFYTVETGRGSTGLGLSIARLLTEKMGGTISAEYREGTLFIILKF